MRQVKLRELLRPWLAAVLCLAGLLLVQVAGAEDGKTARQVVDAMVAQEVS